jgi:RNA polymerase sigma-70 factor (ECF subfamily)
VAVSDDAPSGDGLSTAAAARAGAGGRDHGHGDGGCDPGQDDDALLEDARVEAEIARLPPLQREALLLRYRDDLSYAEIALVAGVPIGTVKTRVHHAKRALKERLQRGHS